MTESRLVNWAAGELSDETGATLFNLKLQSSCSVPEKEGKHCVIYLFIHRLNQDYFINYLANSGG